MLIVKLLNFSMVFEVLVKPYRKRRTTRNVIERATERNVGSNRSLGSGGRRRIGSAGIARAANMRFFAGSLQGNFK